MLVAVQEGSAGERMLEVGQEESAGERMLEVEADADQALSGESPQLSPRQSAGLLGHCLFETWDM